MKPAILATALAAVTTLTADAALITWGAPQNITGDSDVSTAGTFVDAVMFSGFDVGPNTTINGVTFTDVGFLSSSSGVFSWTPVLFHIAGGSGAPFNGLSAAYREMLGSSWDANFTLSMSGLTPGATYEFQWWANFATMEFGTGSTTAVAGNSVTLDQNTTNARGGVGQFAVGSFVADGSSQQVQFIGVGTEARVNGVQLRLLGSTPASVPEPGTALAGVMLAGLLGVRRRRGSQV